MKRQAKWFLIPCAAMALTLGSALVSFAATGWVEENGEWSLFDPYAVPELTNVWGDEFEAKYRAYEADKSIKRDTINAKDLWKKILLSYFETGSPFLCFKDTSNKANPNFHKGVIRSSNLCTEIFQNTAPNYYEVKSSLKTAVKRY